MIDDATISDGEEQARAADREQAAYFRGVLEDERMSVEVLLAQGRRLLETLSENGNRFEARRLQNQIRDQESQLRHVTTMIERLDRCFRSR